MQGIIEGKVFCPKYSDIKLLPCPDPPPKEIILDEVGKVTTEHELDTGATENKVPDKDWLLSVLATLKPDHVFFKKDYPPPHH